MKSSDYIVEFIIGQGITDVFGYPGGMVTHIMDSFFQQREKITVHTSYHEQSAAFAACGFAQTSGQTGVAFATSGPGATNLITGICNAYFDCIPTVFITGQVNSFELKGDCRARQKGFQETDIVSMVSGITKMSKQITCSEQLPKALSEAFAIAQEGRKGPVLLDVTMDASRDELNVLGAMQTSQTSSRFEDASVVNHFREQISELLCGSRKPCILIGNGVNQTGMRASVLSLAKKMQIPIVTSMLAVDLASEDQGGRMFGFIGAYGDRAANFIVAKCDLLICIGTRLDVRQTGGNRESFAPNAAIVRIDIDAAELTNKVRPNEYQYCLSLERSVDLLNQISNNICLPSWKSWRGICKVIKEKLELHDDDDVKRIVGAISEKIPEGAVTTTDVGQNQVWVAQAFRFKAHQRILFSGGHGAMGYSLPAAIGAFYASKTDVYSFNGDGGIQMNIQELQWIVREKIPIKVIILDNKALGMIRHFQEMYFDNRNAQTTIEGGYDSPDFCSIARSYGIKATCVTDLDELKEFSFTPHIPEVLVVSMTEPTYVFPKLEFGKPNQDQEPLLDRVLYQELMDL